MRKHQELLEKCKQSETFDVNEPYGDPFLGMDIKRQLGGGSGSSGTFPGSEMDNSKTFEESDDEDPFNKLQGMESQNNDRTSTTETQNATKASPLPTETKKKRGRAKKVKQVIS